MKCTDTAEVLKCKLMCRPYVASIKGVYMSTWGRNIGTPTWCSSKKSSIWSKTETEGFYSSIWNVFRLVHLFSDSWKKWNVASCPALQVTNVSECGLCWSVFSWFYRTVFLVLVCLNFCSSVCHLYVFWTMAVLEPFSQIKKKKVPV